MKATNIQAARYAAWERTVWYGSDQWESGQKTDDQIKNEVVQRFFSDTASEPLSSTDLNVPAVNPKALWSDHAGTTILGNANATTAGSSTPGTINTYLAIIRDAVNVVGDVLDTNFKLDTQSLYTSTVTLTAAKTDAMALAWNGNVLQGGNAAMSAPTFTERHYLVANGWNANGPAFVTKQTQALAPLNVFNRDPIKPVINFFQSVATTYAEELGSDTLKIGGEIKPDLVPPDRLSVAALGPVAAPPAQTPRKTPAQQYAEKKAAAEATIAPTKAKAKALHDGIDNTTTAIKSCLQAKQDEYMANRYVQHSEDVCDIRLPLIGCVKSHTHYWTTDNGPSNKYTPNADANVACHAGLDQQIAVLQALLSDPDLQRAKTETQNALDKSDAAVRKDPTAANLRADPLFMRNYYDAQNVVQGYQDQIDALTQQKRALDNAFSF